MANLTWINKGDQISVIKIAEAERHYKAVYVADLCLKVKDNWTDEPFSVFWQEKPTQKTHSNYFALFLNRDRKLMITDAISVSEGTWGGAQADSGEIIFSRFRHDYRMSKDKTAMVDGGRDYLRYTGKFIQLKIEGPDFVIDTSVTEPIL